MSPTLEEIARLAGVSRSTVSRVINDSPNVDAETRARVTQVIREHDYHPNSLARSLASRRSQIIGLVIPQELNAVFSDPYFPTLIQGVAAACEQRGYYLMLSLIQSQSSDAYRRIIRSGHLDGLIVASSLVDDSFVDRLASEQFPYVLIGRHPRRNDITTVDADNARGAAMAVQHLVRLGHTRIAMITGPLNLVAAIDRREGFLASMRSAGLSVPDEYLVEGNFTEWSGYEAMQRLLALPDALVPQAVFASSDAMAVGALKAARAAGLRVPEDLALVGFDDIPLATAVVPALTTVRQLVEQLGFTAATLLMDMLQNGSPRPDHRTAPALAVQRIVLPTELVIRESCGQALLFQARRSAMALKGEQGGVKRL